MTKQMNETYPYPYLYPYPHLGLFLRNDLLLVLYALQAGSLLPPAYSGAHVSFPSAPQNPLSSSPPLLDPGGITSDECPLQLSAPLLLPSPLLLLSSPSSDNAQRRGSGGTNVKRAVFIPTIRNNNVMFVNDRAGGKDKANVITTGAKAETMMMATINMAKTTIEEIGEHRFIIVGPSLSRSYSVDGRWRWFLTFKGKATNNLLLRRGGNGGCERGVTKWRNNKIHSTQISLTQMDKMNRQNFWGENETVVGTGGGRNRRQTRQDTLLVRSLYC